MMNHTYFDRQAREVLEQLAVDFDTGLPSEEAEQRRQGYGPNRLEAESRRSKVHILIDQFKSIVIIILLVAALLALITGRYPEAIALVAVTLINTALGFFTEWKAIRSMEALRQLGEHRTRVLRDGELQEIGAEALVPGDIIQLSDGELVPADIRIVETQGVRVNEAALTGESASVNKGIEPVDSSSSLHERASMLYKGTSIAEGTMRGVVTATGMETELGHIARLTAAAEEAATPLQQRLDGLGRRLAWITLAVAFLVGAAGLVAGRETVLMIETAIALGVAAIPEGLPIVATIALARGMWLMARQNALVNRLTAVETLGATTVIFTDKTGTLTENRMQLVQAVTTAQSYALNSNEKHLDQHPQKELAADLRRILQIGALCTNAKAAENGEDRYTGDPTEVALLEAAERYGLNRKDLLDKMPEEQEVSFDSNTMKMATTHHQKSGEYPYYVAVKGAPMAVIKHCEYIWDIDQFSEMNEQQRTEWQEQADKMAAGGLRLLALADKEMEYADGEVYNKLRFAGLVGLEDPPREEVAAAIEQCRHAGIQVLMATGDRPDTGASIGRQVGLADDMTAMHGDSLQAPERMSAEERAKVRDTTVFARVTPEQKLDLVKLYQEEGQIVAMTGDGVNDTPALKQADIGVAMGKRGTDAAKQVADMVLRDDQFSTIVEAVREGRIIYANIRKSVIFMLCTNIAEVLAVTVASLLQIPIPLKPLQILYLNVLTDVFPALALGVGTGGDDVMQRQPRAPEEAVLTGHHWKRIGLWSGIICVDVLLALAVALFGFGYGEKQAVTISFLTLAFAKLWFVINLRDKNTPAWKNDVVANPWIWAAWGICLVLLLAAVYFSPLAAVMQTASPKTAGWLLVLGLSLIPVVLGMVLPGIHFYSSKSSKE